jgi:hypothetical protein
VPGLDAGNIKGKLGTKFGFTPDDGTNHDTFRLYNDGKQIAYVQVGRHTGDIGPGVYKYMARQAGVKTRQFADMIQCTIGKQKYLDLIGVTSPELTPAKAVTPTRKALPRRRELPPGPSAGAGT